MASTQASPAAAANPAVSACSPSWLTMTGPRMAPAPNAAFRMVSRAARPSAAVRAASWLSPKSVAPKPSPLTSTAASRNSHPPARLMARQPTASTARAATARRCGGPRRKAASTTGTLTRAPAKYTLITVPATGKDTPNRVAIGRSSGPYAASMEPISKNAPSAAMKATRLKEVSSAWLNGDPRSGGGGPREPAAEW